MEQANRTPMALLSLSAMAQTAATRPHVQQPLGALAAQQRADSFRSRNEGAAKRAIIDIVARVGRVTKPWGHDFSR